MSLFVFPVTLSTVFNALASVAIDGVTLVVVVGVGWLAFLSEAKVGLFVTVGDSSADEGLVSVRAEIPVETGFKSDCSADGSESSGFPFFGVEEGTGIADGCADADGGGETDGGRWRALVGEGGGVGDSLGSTVGVVGVGSVRRVGGNSRATALRVMGVGGVRGGFQLGRDT